MPQIEFAGYVEPTFLKINAQSIKPIPWKDTNLPPFVFMYRIKEAEVSIICEIETVDEFAVNYTHLVVYSFVASVINCLGFAKAEGFRLILNSCTIPGKEPASLHSGNPILTSICSFTSQEILDMMMADRRIARPLGDLAETRNNPMDSYINVQRAIDGIGLLLSDEEEPSKRWKAIRESLNLSRPYLQFISDLSRGPRHGSTAPVSMVNVAEVQARGWIVMNRFLEFRKRGNVKLEGPHVRQL